MNDAPTPEGTPPDLRFLKGLVTVLTATMILGLVVIVALLVIRLPAGMRPATLGTLPERLMVPEGTRATAFTQGPDWVALVTEANEILIFDRATGRLRQSVQITP